MKTLQIYRMLKIVSTLLNLGNTKFSNVMKLLKLKSQLKSRRLFLCFKIFEHLLGTGNMGFSIRERGGNFDRDVDWNEKHTKGCTEIRYGWNQTANKHVCLKAVVHKCLLRKSSFILFFSSYGKCTAFNFMSPKYMANKKALR